MIRPSRAIFTGEDAKKRALSEIQRESRYKLPIRTLPGNLCMKLSLIIPTHNRAESLRRTIDSVLANAEGCDFEFMKPV